MAIPAEGFPMLAEVCTDRLGRETYEYSEQKSTTLQVEQERDDKYLLTNFDSSSVSAAVG